jgi:hypothetical protein
MKDKIDELENTRNIRPRIPEACIEISMVLRSVNSLQLIPGKVEEPFLPAQMRSILRR